MEEQQRPNRPSFFSSNRLSIKGALLVFMTLLLLIPAKIVEGLIEERSHRQQEAVNEVGKKWGNEQTLVGPVISVPYYDVSKQGHRITSYAHFLPSKLKVNGTVDPEKRRRGIFEVIVYKSDLKVEGSFKHLSKNAKELGIPNLQWENAFLRMGISDLRGIKEELFLNWDGQEIPFEAGSLSKDLMSSAVSAPIQLPLDSLDQLQDVAHNFSFSLALKGASSLSFCPVGKENAVEISSPWNSPSFQGSYLPEYELDKNGFKAKWNVLALNRPFPQAWSGNTYLLEQSSFGFSLHQGVNNYQKSLRSAKYAILFIGLTFLGFFFVEMLYKKGTHPFQYALVGFALCLFYTLLVSFSEHINFNASYWISTAMTIALICLYAMGIFKSKRLGGAMGGILLGIYSFIFVIIQLEDLALLAGSLGLFFILAVVMFFSKRMNEKEVG